MKILAAKAIQLSIVDNNMDFFFVLLTLILFYEILEYGINEKW